MDSRRPPAADASAAVQLGLGFGDAAEAKGGEGRPAADWPGGRAHVDAGWRGLLDAFLAAPPGATLINRIRGRMEAGTAVYPPSPFRALELTPLDQVRVVILGQDSYHGPGQAEGLAFSVPEGVNMPPSLRNLFVERERDLGIPLPARDRGSLAGWARQGVLLLNTVLSVEDGRPASHAGWGWEPLTAQLVEAVARRAAPTVFMLWGAHAQGHRSAIEVPAGDGRHRILVANHPSPLSARRPPVPFIGCGHFGEANRFLARAGRSPIAW